MKYFKSSTIEAGLLLLSMIVLIISFIVLDSIKFYAFSDISNPLFETLFHLIYILTPIIFSLITFAFLQTKIRHRTRLPSLLLHLMLWILAVAIGIILSYFVTWPLLIGFLSIGVGVVPEVAFLMNVVVGTTISCFVIYLIYFNLKSKSQTMSEKIEDIADD